MTTLSPLRPMEEERLVAGVLALPGVDPLAGARVLGAPSVYWERPLGQEAVAGWGEAAVAQARTAPEAAELLEGLHARAQVRWLGEAPRGLPGPWFGGMRFAGAGPQDAAWAAHGFARWVLPEVLVWRAGGHLVAVAFAPEGMGGVDLVRSRLERVRACFPLEAHVPRGEAVALRHAPSEWPRYEALVGRALAAIDGGQLQKVVLARCVEVQAPTDFDVVDVLARLREHNPRCATFCLRAPDGSSFLGATPETLCRVRGRWLETEALAGSAPPGQAEVLGVDKERREHLAVVEDIRTRLQPLADEVSSDVQPALLALKNVVHLRTGIRAGLRRGVGPAQVVAALHPTPAVGGTPRERALGFILEHEGLDRGWYAGPVGWVGPEGAHLVVALRSAWVAGAHARLFVGSGIVAGSTAAAEWQETQLKSLAMLRALGGTDVC